MKVKKKKITIAVFVDAFGYQILKEYEKKNKVFLQGRINHKRKLTSVLGFTNTCLPSILSGQYPNEHGQAGLFFHTAKSPFKYMRYLKHLPKILDRARVRNVVSKVVKKAHGFTGYFQLYSIPFDKLQYFDIMEKENYFKPNSPFNNLFDFVSSLNIEYHQSDWEVSEDENLKSLKEAMKNGKPRFSWLYLPSLDATLHMNGTKSNKIKDKIDSIDLELTKVLHIAEEEYEKVSLYVFSDHGMADVTKGVDIISKIDSLGLVYGVDYVAMYDSSMARFWTKNKIAKREITKKLNEVNDGKILVESELIELKSDFKDSKFGDIVFLLNSGVMIEPSYFGKTKIPGMHGYHPKDPISDAILLSNKEIPKEVNSITDIRNLLEWDILDEH